MKCNPHSRKWVCLCSQVLNCDWLRETFVLANVMSFSILIPALLSDCNICMLSVRQSCVPEKQRPFRRCSVLPGNEEESCPVGTLQVGNSFSVCHYFELSFCLIQWSFITQPLWDTELCGFSSLRSQHDEKMTQFFKNNFSEDRWRKAALKNAFSLLGKQRFEQSAAFFLLAGSLKDAIEVWTTHSCAHKIHISSVAY